MEKTISNARALNKVKGFYFFEPKTMRFFRSKVHGGIIKDNYFITSEQFDDLHPRKFTIRYINWETGDILTHGDFQGYATKEEAKEAILDLASQ